MGIDEALYKRQGEFRETIKSKNLVLHYLGLILIT